MTDKPHGAPARGLEDFFDAARAKAPVPGGDLLARIEAQALAGQRHRAARPAPARRGVWRGLLGALGGWPAMAGLAAAALTGVWLGAAPPEAVLALWPGEAGLSALDPMSGYDFVWVEG